MKPEETKKLMAKIISMAEGTPEAIALEKAEKIYRLIQEQKKILKSEKPKNCPKLNFNKDEME